MMMMDISKIYSFTK